MKKFLVLLLLCAAPVIAADVELDEDGNGFLDEKYGGTNGDSLEVLSFTIQQIIGLQPLLDEKANVLTLEEGQVGGVVFPEDPANGKNETGFRAPSNLTSDVVYTLPGQDGSDGQVLSTDGNRTLSWINPASGGGGGGNMPINYQTNDPTTSSANGFYINPDSGKLWVKVDEGLLDATAGAWTANPAVVPGNMIVDGNNLQGSAWTAENGIIIDSADTWHEAGSNPWARISGQDLEVESGKNYRVRFRYKADYQLSFAIGGVVGIQAPATSEWEQIDQVVACYQSAAHAKVSLDLEGGTPSTHRASITEIIVTEE